MADAGIILNLSVLNDRSGTVQHKRKRLIRRHTERQWIRSQHILHAKGGGDGGARIRTGNTDHILLRGHACPIPGNPIVGRISDRHHAHTVFTRFFDTYIHSLFAGHHTHTIVGVQHGRGRRLF